MRTRPNKRWPLCLPNDCLKHGFDFAPTWQEVALQYHLDAIAQIRAQQTADWLAKQRERVSKAASEIDQQICAIRLAEIRANQLEWFAKTAQKEKEIMAKLT